MSAFASVQLMKTSITVAKLSNDFTLLMPVNYLSARLKIFNLTKLKKLGREEI